MVAGSLNLTSAVQYVSGMRSAKGSPGEFLVLQDDLFPKARKDIILPQHGPNIDALIGSFTHGTLAVLT